MITHRDRQKDIQSHTRTHTYTAGYLISLAAAGGAADNKHLGMKDFLYMSLGELILMPWDWHRPSRPM